MQLIDALVAKINQWIHAQTLKQLAIAQAHPNISNDQYQKMLAKYNAMYGVKKASINE